MSWNGTVRCSYCYQSGHNRRGCEKLTLDVKERYETQRARADEVRAMTDEEYKGSPLGRRHACSREDLLRHYEAYAEDARKTYLKRTKIDLATGQKVTNKAAKAARMKNVRCGYCGNYGHTRRTCQNLKNDYLIWRTRTIEVRQEWLKDLTARGIGVGTMIIKEYTGYGGKDNNSWGSHRVAGLVAGFNWNSIDANSERGSITIRDNNTLAGRRSYASWGITSLAEIDHSRKQQEAGRHNADKYTIFSTGSVPEPPAGWLSDDVPTITEEFPSKQKRDYEWKGYNTDLQRWQDKTREALGLPVDAYDE